MNGGLGLTIGAWHQFRMIGESLGNYAKCVVQKLVAVYFGTLFGFDLLGKVIGGPYQFGYLFWAFAALLLVLFILDRFVPHPSETGHRPPVR